MSESQRPKVGVGVIIHDNAGNIVMGERMGSHGAGKISTQPPSLPQSTKEHLSLPSTRNIILFPPLLTTTD